MTVTEEGKDFGLFIHVTTRNSREKGQLQS